MRAVEPLDGGFSHNSVEQFNSNFPEVLTRLEGPYALAASTLSPDQKEHPEVHLNHGFRGDFRLFSSHQNRTPDMLQETLVLFNPNPESATIRVKALVSLCTRQAGYAPGPLGDGPDGPGEAVSRGILMGRGERSTPILLDPGQMQILSQQNHPCGSERMTQAELFCDQPIQVALLYHQQPLSPAQLESALEQAHALPTDAGHDHEPSLADATPPIVYGRVAGVVANSEYVGAFSNNESHDHYCLLPGQCQRFALNTTRNHPRWDGVDDAAPMLKRLPGSAYASHGNYGAHFTVRGRLHNDTRRSLKTTLSIESDGPLRQSFRLVLAGGTPQEVRVLAPKGTVAPRPLAEVVVGARQSCDVQLEFFYAANNQPPQRLRLETPLQSVE